MNELLVSSFEEDLRLLLSLVVGREMDNLSQDFKTIAMIHERYMYYHGEIPDIADIVDDVEVHNEVIMHRIVDLDHSTGRGSESSCWPAIEIIPQKDRLRGFSEKGCLYDLWYRGVIENMDIDLSDHVFEVLMEMDLAYAANKWEHPMGLVMDTTQGSIWVVVNDCQNTLFEEWNQEYAFIAEEQYSSVSPPYALKGISWLYDLMMATSVVPGREVY